ncbi:uncharacterized protein PV09_08740 [Verruconis gallopava]|uniref:Uncharacterized protein n=1 Tax=Verruconis gallopava TaxID=253628 RepID=A0A0D1ZYS1_9PEZI|nr:uncharacterized protein PV09_08740 [Verruconis gallopava]KIV99562.1 hypothetical protein PV09_08740 [Verruconis gallopava]
MFGVIVSGRPVLTAFEKISDTQIKFSIPSHPPFNHLVVFTLPGASLPVDAAAACYLQIAPSADFKLLGALSNDKQSAIFKIRNTAVGTAMHGIGVVDEDVMTDGGAPGSNDAITLGISLEPIAQVEANLAAAKAAQGGTTTGQELVRAGTPIAAPRQTINTKLLAQRIIQNAFNFLSSFSSGGSNDAVPLKSFEEWWKKFEKKIDLDPGFLERETG